MTPQTFSLRKIGNSHQPSQGKAHRPASDLPSLGTQGALARRAPQRPPSSTPPYRASLKLMPKGLFRISFTLKAIQNHRVGWEWPQRLKGCKTHQKMKGNTLSQEFLPSRPELPCVHSPRAGWDSERGASGRAQGGGQGQGHGQGRWRAGACTFFPPWGRGPSPAGAGCPATRGPGGWHRDRPGRATPGARGSGAAAPTCARPTPRGQRRRAGALRDAGTHARGTSWAGRAASAPSRRRCSCASRRTRVPRRPTRPGSRRRRRCPRGRPGPPPSAAGPAETEAC